MYINVPRDYTNIFILFPLVYSMSAGAWSLIALIVVIVFIVMKVASKKQEVAVKAVLMIFLFFMLTAGYVYVAYGADLTTYDGATDAFKLYFIWLGQAFRNVVGLTGDAVKQQWALNSTTINQTLAR